MTVLLWIIISSSQDMDNQTECDKHYTTLTANPPQTPLPFSNLDLITQTHLLPFSSIYSSASLRLQKKKINFIWAPQRCRYSLSIANCKIKAEVSSMQCMITCSCGIPALNHLSFSVIQVFQTKQVTSKYFLTYMDLLFLVGFSFFLSVPLFHLCISPLVPITSCNNIYLFTMLCISRALKRGLSRLSWFKPRP